MKTWKKKLFNALVAATPFRRQLFNALAPNDICDSMLILTYHMVADENSCLPDWCCLSTDQFAKQMKYMAKNFEVMELSRGMSSLLQRKKRKKPIAAITFDDGFYNNFSAAFPILKETNIPATIFLSTNYINSDDTLWFCRLNKALHNTTIPTLEWQGRTFDTSTRSGKCRVYSELQQMLKKLSNRQLHHELDVIISGLGDNPKAPIKRSSVFRMLDTEAILEMMDSGLITFGAHTDHHVILSRETRELQKEQILASIDYVKRLTGRDDIAFAYPNGSKDDYNSVSLEEVAAAGVSCAVTMTEGFNRFDTAALELKRIGVGGDWRMGLFQYVVHVGSSSDIFSKLKFLFAAEST